MKRAAAVDRRVDEALTILEYFPASLSGKLSVVAARLNGEHTLRRNLECDQVYYVLDGTGTITVDGQVDSLAKDDGVFVGAGQVHSLQGTLELLIINGPAYDPAQTEVL